MPITLASNIGLLPSCQVGIGVDLTSYAELAVRLVNTASLGQEAGDRLRTVDGLRALVADREHLKTGISRSDLEALRDLRTEFREFFVACSRGDGEDAAAALNALLIQHPVHPQLSGHDGQPWHVHYTESGSVSDRYAAGAVMGLAVRLAEIGIERFGICQATPCQGVFVDTSGSRTRRYCSDRCMNRANVTAYRARRRGEDGDGGDSGDNGGGPASGESVSAGGSAADTDPVAGGPAATGESAAAGESGLRRFARFIPCPG